MEEVEEVENKSGTELEVTNENITSSGENSDEFAAETVNFKKPDILIGPRKGQYKFKKVVKASQVEGELEQPVSHMIPQFHEKCIPVDYLEPEWSKKPEIEYYFEVLKSGSIIERIELSNKPYYVFGRLVNSDITMAHPSISRHHAILQYKAVKSEDDDLPVGFYLYDLNSTHGTFLNKHRLMSNKYVRVQVGHMIKLGLSSRCFLLQGPEDDQEEETEETVTQLKEQHKKEQEKIRQEEMDWENERIQTKTSTNEEAVSSNKDNDGGIDWGMGEDADEETDLSHNPFASTQNEDLYINDPKKTLRGWFEREGHELIYDCQEKGFAQFICKVELPIDDSQGLPVIAEAIVSGKKKSAVVQCALEACRLLDQHGLLRQAKHESRKRKIKNWEENDFYDSDEDTFLDRTGTVEKKREARMKQAGVVGESEVYTYEKLVNKHQEIERQIKNIQMEITQLSQVKVETKVNNVEDEDELDQFMSNLSSSSSVDRKIEISKLKAKMNSLKSEEIRIRKLANIARPPQTPELKSTTQPALLKDKRQMPLTGKRPTGMKKPWKPSQSAVGQSCAATSTTSECSSSQDKEYETDSD